MKKERKQRPRMEDLIPNSEIRKEVLKALYSGEGLTGRDGIFSQLLQDMVNAALEGEMDAQISESREEGSNNRRNGHTQKTLRSKFGPIEVSPPRDRAGKFEPKVVGKWERELHTGFDEMILSLYGRGQSVEDIRHHLAELYGVDLSTGTISAVTSRVWNRIVEWQSRPLSPCYAIIYLDGIHYKVRQEGRYDTKVVQTVYGVDSQGSRDVLGLYVEAHEGARNWGLVLEDLKRRGVEDVLFFCVDGLKGFKEVIEEVFPQSIVQRCVVHMIRSSTRFVKDKDIKAVCADLRKIYTAATEGQALNALAAFKEKWDKPYKEIAQKWEESWNELMAFMAFKSDIRRMIYTTNPVEALHRVMRKVTKAKGAWTDENALTKQLFLALTTNEKSWKRQAYHWKGVQKELSEHFGERFSKWIDA